MVGMLVALDGRHLLLPVVLHRGLARQVGNADHPAEAGFGAILPGRDDMVGPVEIAGQDLDLGSIDEAETERRAAGGAKVTQRDRGGLERGRLAARPAETLALDIGEGGERCAGRLLAHPAVADADPGGGLRHHKADGAALAAAGQNGFWHIRHAYSIRPQASRKAASASPPAKMKLPTPAPRSAASCSPGRPAR